MASLLVNYPPSGRAGVVIDPKNTKRCEAFAKTAPSIAK